MVGDTQNKQGGSASTQGGFLQLIILFVVLILLMKYFGVSFHEVNIWIQNFFGWFKNYFASVFN